jgi:hypothetical protein
MMANLYALLYRIYSALKKSEAEGVLLRWPPSCTVCKNYSFLTGISFCLQGRARGTPVWRVCNLNEKRSLVDDEVITNP